MHSRIFAATDMLSLALNGKVDDANEEPRATFFVSTDGNDSWSGRLVAPNAAKTDGPFATIARARDAIRVCFVMSRPPRELLIGNIIK